MPASPLPGSYARGARRWLLGETFFRGCERPTPAFLEGQKNRRNDDQYEDCGNPLNLLPCLFELTRKFGAPPRKIL